MAEAEPQFIVLLPSGRRSKPTTETRIREMYAAGSIPDHATVLKVGTVVQTPVRVFLKLTTADLAAEIDKDEPDDQPDNQPDDKSDYQTAVEAEVGTDVEPAVEARGFPLDSRRSSPTGLRATAVRTTRYRETDGFLAAIASLLSWPLQGFIIPARGVGQTRDYLRRTIAWIEIWLKLIHLASLAVLLMMAIGGVTMLIAEIRFLQQNGARNLWGMFLRILFASYTYLAVFIFLMITQAFLRVIPASLRYWIETTEERRDTDRLTRTGIDQQPEGK